MRSPAVVTISGRPSPSRSPIAGARGASRGALSTPAARRRQVGTGDELRLRAHGPARQRGAVPAGGVDHAVLGGQHELLLAVTVEVRVAQGRLAAGSQVLRSTAQGRVVQRGEHLAVHARRAAPEVPDVTTRRTVNCPVYGSVPVGSRTGPAGSSRSGCVLRAASAARTAARSSVPKSVTGVDDVPSRTFVNDVGARPTPYSSLQVNGAGVPGVGREAVHRHRGAGHRRVPVRRGRPALGRPLSAERRDRRDLRRRRRSLRRPRRRGSPGRIRSGCRSRAGRGPGSRRPRCSPRARPRRSARAARASRRASA